MNFKIIYRTNPNDSKYAYIDATATQKEIGHMYFECLKHFIFTIYLSIYTDATATAAPVATSRYIG